MKLTKFENRVMVSLRKIPYGKVTTYQAIANYLGEKGGARAVGNACHKNPLAPVVPCHRVVRSDGKIGGYAKGVKQKMKLLRSEDVLIYRGKVVNFKDKLFSY